MAGHRQLRYQLTKSRVCAASGKRSYRTEIDARIALGRAKLSDDRAIGEGHERSVYRCPHGAHWHLTKKRSR